MRAFSEGITTGSVSRYTGPWCKVSVVRKKRRKKIKYSESKKSIATKVIKHLASKEGLKLSTKVLAKAASKLSKLFMHPAKKAADQFLKQLQQKKAEEYSENLRAQKRQLLSSKCGVVLK